jgi:hypothetical protein
MSNHNRGLSIDASYQVSVHKNCLWQPCLLMDRDKMSTLYWGLPIDTSYQVSVYLAKRIQRWRIFKKIRHSETRVTCGATQCGPCLLTDREEMSNLYRGPSIDAFYQDSLHLVKCFQRRRFLEIDQSERRIACGGYLC